MGNGDTHGSDNIPLIMAGGGGAIRRGVMAAGGPAYTPLHMIHTGAVLLGADQSGIYQGYQTEVIPGIIV